jgi:pimeloyl-ACP methyl ester carboxylesterase
MALKEQKVSVRNGMFNVTVYRGGSGDPLVFLHAAGIQRPEEPFLDLLAQKYDLIVPVHPGWPGSDGLEHLDDVIDMAVYYGDLFDTLGLDSFHLMGSSLGGMFAAEVAALDRQYVRKLVLHSPAGLWLDDHPYLDFFAAPQDVLMKALYTDPDKAMAAMPKVDPENKEATARATLDRAMSLAAAGKFIWPIWDKGLKKRIHRINAPTLLIWGDKDGLNPPVYGPHWQKQIPDSKLVTIPGTAHVPMAEKPEEYVKAVTDFLG